MKRPDYPVVYQATTNLRVRDIGEWALASGANHALLVVRFPKKNVGSRRYKASIEIGAKVFGERLIEIFEADAWPVCQLFGHTATVLVGRFDHSTVQRMERFEPLLSGWAYGRQRPFPEDLCIFRRGASMPRFASVVHENESYFFARTPPRFATNAEKADGVGSDVPVGRFFCSVPKP